MKRRDLLKLWEVLNRIESEKFTLKFSYFVAKNKLKVKDEITLLNELRVPNQEYVKFDNERIELAKQFSDKDSKGNPKSSGGNFVITERLDEFKKEIEVLMKKYEQSINDFEKNLIEYNKLIDEEYTFNGSIIKYDELPDHIEPDVLEILMKCNLIIEE